MEKKKLIQQETTRYVEMRKTVFKYIFVTFLIALAFLIIGVVIFIIYGVQKEKDKILFLIGTLSLAAFLAINISMFLPYLNLRNIKAISQTNIGFHLDPNSQIERISGENEIMELGNVFEFVQSEENLEIEEKKDYKPNLNRVHNYTKASKIYTLKATKNHFKYKNEQEIKIDYKHLFLLDKTGQINATLTKKDLEFNEENNYFDLSKKIDYQKAKFLLIVLNIIDNA